MISLLKANMSFINSELNLKFNIMDNKRLKNKLALAFPMTDYKFADNMMSNGMSPFGMTKRFYAACAAMQGILASYAGIQIKEFPAEWIVKESYKLADELLKQETE